MFKRVIMAVVTAFLFPPCVFAGELSIVSPIILDQGENAKGISFEIENRMARDSEVRYGIRAVERLGDREVVVDEQAYPDPVVVPGKSSSRGDFLYVIPKGLNGRFDLVVAAEDADGVPLASVVVGEISSSATGVWIDPESCFLRVSEEDGEPRHGMSGGASITADQDLMLSCSVKNHGSESVPTIPVYTTHYRTPYGGVVKGVSGGSAPTTMFAPGEQKEVMFSLPKASDPQRYVAEVSLVSFQGKTNTVLARYAVKGESATITKLSFDKESYHSGDIATVSFLWEPSADQTSPSAVSAVATLTATGVNCGSESVPISTSNGIDSISVPITTACADPTVRLVLKGSEGADLATKSVVFDAGAGQMEKMETKTPELFEAPASTTPSVFVVVIALVLVPIIVVIVVAVVRHRRFVAFRNTFRAVLFAAVLSAGAFLGSESADAWYCTGSGASQEWCSNAGVCSSCPMPGSLCTASGCQIVPATNSIRVTPSQINSGQSATVSWSSGNTSSCAMNGSSVPTSGSTSTGTITNRNTYTEYRSYALICRAIPYYGPPPHVGAILGILPGVPASSCTLPWGGTTSNGSSVTAYQSPSGTTCYSQTRSCTNGSLSGSYQYGSCSVTAPASCMLPWGGTTSNGSSVTAYQSPSGTTCYSQTRSCANGSLSGSYQYGSCSVVVPIPTPSLVVCPVNPTVEVGRTQQMTAYYKANGSVVTCSNTTGSSTVTGSASWTSGAPARASVNASGLVTGVAVGTSQITGTYSGRTSSTTVTVTPPPCVADCSESGNHCQGETFTDKNNCVANNCSGTRYCDFNWKEVTPQ